MKYVRTVELTVTHDVVIGSTSIENSNITKEKTPYVKRTKTNRKKDPLYLEETS